ncbi:O-antigen ligase family protein, partial [Acidimicrobiia bacterium]|nr:O-antigen ligase family protein [Acidimicrobiia bacterium]
IISFITLPLFLTLSRASFFAGTFFIITLNSNFLQVIKQNKKKFFILFLLSIILFVLSAIRLAAIPDIDLRSEEPVVIQVVGGSISEVAERKSTFQFLGFYACEDRICSKDNTLDWRFDIWNDLVRDQISKNKLLLGFGFNEIFEIMKDPQAPGRLGREGLNEHVHNHFFTIIGRMGVIGLFVYILFQYKLIKLFDFNFIIFFVPLVLVSMIDTTMESVQFPFLLYFLISYRRANFDN